MHGPACSASANRQVTHRARISNNMSAHRHRFQKLLDNGRLGSPISGISISGSPTTRKLASPVNTTALSVLVQCTWKYVLRMSCTFPQKFGLGPVQGAPYFSVYL